MNLGYCCINMQLSNPKDYGSDNDRITMNRTMIKRTFQEKGLDYTSELILKNCSDLFKIIQWNEDNDIKLFRMSSETFPWASEYYQDWDSVPQIDDIKQTLEYCGLLATKYGQRLTFHPGPFNVLVSPNEQVVQ